MPHIPITQAIAWGWIEFPPAMLSGVKDAERGRIREYRSSLFIKVRAELKPYGLEPVVLYASTFSLIKINRPRVSVFEGEFEELCQHASRYLTEEGNE